MTIPFIIIALLVLFLVLYGKRLLHRLVAPIIKQRHFQILSMFKAMPTQAKPIIFLGDSITEGAEWSELFPESNVLNRGIGGDTTAGVLNRLDEVCRHQAESIFILIGTNDIGQGFPTHKIISNYKEILHKLKQDSPETKIYVQSVLPVNLGNGSFFNHNNKGVLALNAELKDLCTSLNIEYIDLHAKFLDHDGNLRAEFTNDGLHLVGEGYLYWKSLIEGLI